MPDTDLSNNNSSLTINQSQAIISETSNTDYDTHQIVSTEATLQDRDFFISHASDGEGASDGERQLTLRLSKILKDIHKFKIFFDKDNIKSSIDRDIEKAIGSCQFAILICSPRYLTRYNEISRIHDEVNFFKHSERSKQKYMIIPVLFGVTHEEFVNVMPMEATRLYIPHDQNKVQDINIEELALAIIERAKLMNSDWKPHSQATPTSQT